MTSLSVNSINIRRRMRRSNCRIPNSWKS